MIRTLIVCLFMVSGCGLAYSQSPDTMAVHAYYVDTFCTNQTLLINNHFYGPDNPTGTEIIPGGAFNGADSVIHIQLTFLSPPVYNLVQTLCVGDTIWVNGDPYHAQHWLGMETIENGAFNGCDSIVKINLSIAQPVASILIDTLCSGASVVVNGNVYDVDKPVGTEIIEAGAFNGCDSTIQVQLTFIELALDLGADTEIVLGDSVCIVPAIDFEPVNWVWSPAPPCPDCQEGGCIQALVSQSFTLSLQDKNGCQVSDDVYVKVRDERLVYAPNAMNPDAAYPNNYFFLGAGAQVSNVRQLIIADRWGGVVFDAKNLAPNVPDTGWDGFWRGKKADPGVFTWWAEIEYVDGKSEPKTGTITVLRF